MRSSNEITRQITTHAVILECSQLWVNITKEFLPTLHANGDGTFRTDSVRVIKLREEMRMWVPGGAEKS